MSAERSERQEDKKRKAIFCGNQGIRRDVWEEAMRLTRQSERQIRQQTQPREER